MDYAHKNPQVWSWKGQEARTVVVWEEEDIRIAHVLIRETHNLLSTPISSRIAAFVSQFVARNPPSQASRSPDTRTSIPPWLRLSPLPTSR